MKKLLLPLSLLLVLGFAGCGKKKSELDKNKKNVEVAQNQVPVYESEEDKFFDFNEGEVKDFDFVPGSDNKKSKKVASKEDETWEEEDLSLTWEDEKDGKTNSFKVVNFDLNRNDIRADQKNKVETDVKVAQSAVEQGKKLIVAGHCCPLGSASYNMSLSEKRAKTISDEMIKNGIPKENVTVLGCGSEHPIVESNSSDRQEKIKELAPNRRAEISVH